MLHPYLKNLILPYETNIILQNQFFCNILGSNTIHLKLTLKQLAECSRKSS